MEFTSIYVSANTLGKGVKDVRKVQQIKSAWWITHPYIFSLLSIYICI